MTNNKIIKVLEEICVETVDQELAINKVIDLLQTEPLTDIEQQIFLTAMSREEKIYKAVYADGEGKDLAAICHSIEKR